LVRFNTAETRVALQTLTQDAVPNIAAQAQQALS
jgi:hypothetical protein